MLNEVVSMNREAHSPAIISFSQWLRLLLGLGLVFFLFHGTADRLASDRGQAGLFIGALVVTATLVVERVLFRQRGLVAARTLGLGPPRAIGLIAAIATGSLLLSVIIIFVQVRGASFAFFPGWVSLVGGLFAQAGVAEETLFRGYLFGRVRLGRTFWRAAVLSMLPFVAVHLFLFLTMSWPLALASVLLAVVISFPLAHLFELGGRTIWAPAILHFVIQGAVKVVIVSDGGDTLFPLVWMLASALLPLLVLIVARPKSA